MPQCSVIPSIYLHEIILHCQHAVAFVGSIDFPWMINWTLRTTEVWAGAKGIQFCLLNVPNYAQSLYNCLDNMCDATVQSQIEKDQKNWIRYHKVENKGVTFQSFKVTPVFVCCSLSLFWLKKCMDSIPSITSTPPLTGLTQKRVSLNF